MLRHGERAITAQDLADLAAAASADVVRVSPIVPAFNPFDLWLGPQDTPSREYGDVAAGEMGVIVVPGADAPRPTPSLGLLRLVREYLRDRCPPTADVWVAGPEWIAVTVRAAVAAVSVESADALAGRVAAALDGFLHPLTGGPVGEGWDFGRTPHRSELIALVETVEGVDHVRSLTVSVSPETTADRRVALERALRRSLAEASVQPALDPDLQRWLDRALVYSGQHEIDVVSG